MSRPIYLDYAATTPVDPLVAAHMAECLTLDGTFGNPASRSHAYGWDAEERVEAARAELAALVNCDVRELVWTSGATEANNLAIKGLVERRAERGRHIVTSAIEHKAVLDSCHALEARGFEVTYLAPNSLGETPAALVAGAMRRDTVLVSIMHANNEIGTVNDIAAIGQVVRAAGAVFHVDAAQSLGKLPIDLATLPVDLMSFSAHKLYGPKGVGALFVRRAPGLELAAQIHGGGQERGMRSGTLPTHQIVGFGTAASLAQTALVSEPQQLQALRERLWRGLAQIDGVRLNSAAKQRLPGLLNVGFSGVDGEVLMSALTDIAVSNGSACTSLLVEPSYVLRALGIPDPVAHASIRLTVGRFTTEADVDHAVGHLRGVLDRLHGFSAKSA